MTKRVYIRKQMETTAAAAETMQIKTIHGPLDPGSAVGLWMWVCVRVWRDID
jgi:hypothetical protein